MENGLEIASKKFDQLEKIYLLEFIDDDEKLLIIGKGSGQDSVQVKLIIWDIYNTGKEIESKTLEKLPIDDDRLCTRLARTSGYLLLVDDEENVTSVLKKVNNELKQDQSKETDGDLDKKQSDKQQQDQSDKKQPDKQQSEKHIIHFDKNNKIVDEKEPWITEDYGRESYCLYNDEKETLQLIVGRSTVQIWHQIHPDQNKKMNDLPNKGEPFLEYIWTNGIPVDQEREETRLQVEEFKCESNYVPGNKICDFKLKVFWYERIICKVNGEIKKVIVEENIEIEEMMRKKERRKNRMERKEGVIQWKDIAEKISAVRHACRALGHLNKRANYNKLVDYVKIHRVSVIIEYTVFTMDIYLLIYYFFLIKSTRRWLHTLVI
jgi:hypothetical protein